MGKAVPAQVRRALQAITDSVTALGFGVAAANLVVGDRVVVVAVAGCGEAATALLDSEATVASWEAALASARPWGDLRFVDHADSRRPLGELPTWVPSAASPVGAWHPDDALLAPLRDDDGRLLGVLSVDVPTSGRRPDEATCRALEAFAVAAALAVRHAGLADRAQRQHRRMRAMFDAGPLPVLVVGPDRMVAEVNPAFTALFGVSAEEVIGRSPRSLCHLDDLDRLLGVVHATRADGEPRAVEVRIAAAGEKTGWARVHVAWVDEGGPGGSLLLQIEDLTARRRAEQRLRRRAQNDDLTGLPNRAETMRRLRVAVAEDARLGRTTGVLFCDVNGLRWLNDTFGQATGDRYLREVGRRLGGAARGVDLVGRAGSDEFVVVAPGLLDADEGVRLAHRLLEALHTPWNGVPAHVAPSMTIGLACSGPGAPGPVATSADELLQRAVAAMYEAKDTERGSLAVWADDGVPWRPPDYELLSDLRDALPRDQLELHYQPVVDLRTGGRIGEEALLRWRHPRLGVLAPAQFLDVLLGSEFEAPVTDWVISTAAARVRRTGTHVAVNVSAGQISRPELPAVVGDALARAGVAPQLMSIELTEDRLLDRADSVERLEHLHATGVNLTLDDFGTGYAGLHYLARFPTLAAIKLDGSFIAAMTTSSVALHVVRSAVSLATDCGLRVVAEGVERKQQADLVTELGAHYGQGYYFGRPVPDPSASDRQGSQVAQLR